MHRYCSINQIGSVLLFALLLSALPVGGDALADGWTQRRGGGYYQIRFEMLRTRSYFEPTGNRLSVPLIGAYRTSFYGEYGVTDRITVVAYIPLERVTLNRQVGRVTGAVLDPGDTATGLADAVAGLRVGLLSRGRTVVSASFMLGVPIGDADQESGLYTGDGEFNQQIAVELGHGFGRAAYAVATAGFNNRTSGFSDEFAYRVEVGSDLYGRFSGAIRVGGVEPFRNGDAVLGGRGLRGNDQRMMRYGVEGRYAVTPAAGFAVSVERAVRVQNGLGGTTFGASVFVKM